LGLNVTMSSYLVAQEVQSKEARYLALRMRMAGFPVEKRLDEFDFEFQPSLDRAVINDIASLKYVHNGGCSDKVITALSDN